MRCSSIVSIWNGVAGHGELNSRCTVSVKQRWIIGLAINVALYGIE